MKGLVINMGQLHDVINKNGWVKVNRPGYFGRRRDEIVLALDTDYGKGNWRLVWSLGEYDLEFEDACILFYEWSYYVWLVDRPEEVDNICSYGECIDNAMSNIQSGTDYTKQEAYSTHIQDIAVRNCLKILLRKFEGPADNILVIRSSDSNGYKYGPGNIPFHTPDMIEQKSIKPKWANYGSVEDFWQSNKWIAVKESVLR